MNPPRFSLPGILFYSGILLAASPVQAGLLARYTFENAANREEDTSGNSNTGTIGGVVNAATFAADTVAGAAGTVLDTVANASTSLGMPNTTVTAASTAYTVAGWLKTSDTNGYFFGQRDNDASPDRLIITPASSNGVLYNGSVWTSGSKNFAARTADFLDGQWHHFACVVDGTSVTVYRDGTVYDTMTLPAVGSGLKPVAGNLRQRFGIDGDSSGASKLEGRYDDLRLYNHALSAAEIGAIVSPGDSDLDGLPDGWELGFPGITDLADLDGTLAAGSGPGAGSGDFDGDGLSDLDEFNEDTSPVLVDTDGDGISDKNELEGKDASGVVHAFGPTNPTLADSDSDGIRDDYELTSKDGSGTTHAFGATNPSGIDTDMDGMSDPYELANSLGGGLDPTTDDADGNLDGDAAGWTNLDEFQGINTGGVQTRADKADTDDDGYPDIVEDHLGSWFDVSATGTNPAIADTDNDGLIDGNENPDLMFPGPGALPTNSSPLLADTDADGIRDGNEVTLGTRPAEADSDGDTFADMVEVLNGSDPTLGSSTPAGTPVFAGTNFAGALTWINTGDGVTADPGSPLLPGGGGNGLLNSNANGTGAMVSFPNPGALSYYSIDVRYTGTLNGQGFNVVSGNNPVVQTGNFNHCALRFQPNGSFGYSNGGTFNTNGAPAGTHLPDRTYTVQFVHDIPNNSYTIRVYDRSNGDAIILAVTPAIPTRNTTPGATLYFGGGVQQDSTNAFTLRLDNLFVSSSPMAPATATAPEPPVITASFFDGPDYKIQFSPGGSGFMLTSSNDLVAPFTEETAATYDGVNTFTVPASALNPGRDFFRVQTAP